MPSVIDFSPLETGEMLNILQQILVAGNETTTNLVLAPKSSGHAPLRFM